MATPLKKEVRKCKPSQYVKFQPSKEVEFCSYCGSLMVDMIYANGTVMLSCKSAQCTSSFIGRSRNNRNKGSE